jgi:hypothetical protein
MGLKISHLDANRVTATLDGMIPFSATRRDDVLEVRIADWRQEFSADDITGESGMRYPTYLALANFRADQKHAALRAA